MRQAELCPLCAQSWLGREAAGRGRDMCSGFRESVTPMTQFNEHMTAGRQTWPVFQQQNPWLWDTWSLPRTEGHSEFYPRR